jgi:hypothetical protein
MGHITDEQAFGQESPTDGSAEAMTCLADESITSDFCPFLYIRCLCWADGDCHAGQCVVDHQVAGAA